MTESEAIKTIQLDICNGCECIENCITNQCEYFLAIKALEKQIANKPYVQQDDRNNDCMECPFCDSFIGYECDCRDEHYQIDYCPNCGQAIDWSDEE